MRVAQNCKIMGGAKGHKGETACPPYSLMADCVKEGNEDTSASETDMTVVTLPYQKLKYWKKLWLEGTI